MATSPASRDPRDRAEAVFEKLFEFSPDAILVINGKGRIVRVNAQTEKIFGYERDELVGQTIESLIPERFRADHPRHREDYSSHARSRPMGMGLQLFGLRKDGREFPVDIMLSPIEGEPGVVLTVVRDITERVRLEQALRRSEHQFRLIVEGIRDYAIFLLDSRGNVATWNSGAERIKGYSAQEIIGQHFSRFYRSEDVARGKPEKGLRIATEQGRYEDEGWRVRKDGSRFWANVILTAIREENGEIVGFAKVTRDFTDRKKAEEALLLQLSTALLSNLDIQKLLSAISAGIQQVVPHDYATLALLDEDARKLRFQVLGGDDREQLRLTETAIPLQDLPGTRAFLTREPLLMSPLPPSRFVPETFEELNRAGLQSGCWLPLKGRERFLGTLMVASRRENAFTAQDLDMLEQTANQIAIAVDNALAFRQITELRDKLALEKQYLEEELYTENSFDEIVGESAALKKVLKQVETVAPTDATVLILGETGTGKELIARAIHNLSGRSGRTFVKLNCAAIPTGLLESELFGHERGAFTGAISQKVGRLELAHQGTLFLDEVGDIPIEIQPKLLRALQEKEFERLGSTRTINVDVRLVAATNRNLAAMVEDRSFRSDLYYRLNVFPIQVPPLRERADDIPILVHYFTQRFAKRMDRRIDHIPTEAMQALTQWHWPGNIRELENLIERAVILSRGHSLVVPIAEIKSSQPPPKAQKTENQTLEDAEREHILKALKAADWKIAGPAGAAARLGMKRTTLNSKMKKLGITRD